MAFVFKFKCDDCGREAEGHPGQPMDELWGSLREKGWTGREYKLISGPATYRSCSRCNKQAKAA